MPYDEHTHLFIVVSPDCDECQDEKSMVGFYIEEATAHACAKEAARRWGITYVFEVIEVGRTTYNADRENAG